MVDSVKEPAEGGPRTDTTTPWDPSDELEEPKRVDYVVLM